MAVLSRSDLGILSFLANSDFVAISREYLYANHLGDVSQMVRDEVVRIKEDGVAVMVNKCTWLLLEKIITRYNSRLMSLSKTKATRRSPCYGEERLFLAFLGCWLGRLFRRSLLLVGTLVELGCNMMILECFTPSLSVHSSGLKKPSTVSNVPLVSLSNDSVCSFLRHASIFMKADTRLVSSPFFS